MGIGRREPVANYSAGKSLVFTSPLVETDKPGSERSSAWLDRRRRPTVYKEFRSDRNCEPDTEREVRQDPPKWYGTDARS